MCYSVRSKQTLTQGNVQAQVQSQGKQMCLLPLPTRKISEMKDKISAQVKAPQDQTIHASGAVHQVTTIKMNALT